MTSNIEKFDLLVGRIFALLYAEFPIRTPITPGQFGIDEDAVFDGMHVNTEIERELDFLAGTVLWLAQSGYLVFKEEHPNACFSDVTLSAKALEVLKATPSSVSGKKTLGEYLQENAKKGAAEAMQKGVS